MTDELVDISVSRLITSWCDEIWVCHGPVPENWNSMTTEERFDWVSDNFDYIHTNEEFPKGTLNVESVELDND